MKVAHAEIKPPAKNPPGQPARAATSDSELRKATDCGYLRAAIDSSRQLRNVLTTRSYHSTEDVELADARTSELITEYRRVCG